MPRRWTNANKHGGISPFALGGLLDQLRYEWRWGQQDHNQAPLFRGERGVAARETDQHGGLEALLPPLSVHERDEETHE